MLGAGASGHRHKDPTGILRRDIFDSQTGDLTASPIALAPTSDDQAPVEIDPNAPPPPCDSSMRLVAAVVHARRPEWSFAAISGASGKAMLYRAGMQVDNDELVGIQSNRVYMRPSGGAICSLEMFSQQETPTGPNSPPTVAVARRPMQAGNGKDAAGISTAQMDSNIQRVSDSEFNVNHSLVSSVLENQAALMREARIIPHEEGGRVVGVKLYGIRRNSLLGKLGLQNGDMLRTINGFDMTSPDSALEAYARLRSADHLSVAVVRRGQAMTIDYNIR